MKKIIYTQRVEIIESYGERRDCADQRIAKYIRECGYIPVPVPNIPDIVKEFVEEIKPDGIVLTGGNSLVKYGGNAPERDATDNLLIDIAVKREIPLYGFCRGMQSIFDYFGNELVRVSGHVAVMHDISGEEVSSQVNSYHNEACIELMTTELTVLMKSKDGVIEKIKHKKLPIVGTMWHPERYTHIRNCDLELLKKIVEGEKNI
ncbi:gamma-glutamyl-gamma-aminobutyrate hydrolase family protein [Anaerovibrio sp. JC8]|uniref:gamma-glutamyl-gamma-aminobutyrate hydrolase family protein n=1 Tax=Anaerovibrio sp. JC8 TaxID=1240085 RepID=UPI000A113C6C|nr:gamma-glutamyl-gamma-aminobutyrate hydrolase family protein [Anaerovibrio sp. JC8]